MSQGVGAAFALIIIAIGLLVGVGVVQYSVASTGVQKTYTEEFTPGSSGSLIVFNQSQEDEVYYSPSVNVTDKQNDLMQPGLDYEWHKNNGTLRVLDGDLDNDSSATITYSLRIPTSKQKGYASLLGGFLNTAYALPLVLGAAIVIAGITVLGGLS